ncbi:hypothetical protein HAX54_009181 [Datura stramonium]|uniref:Uncharacterized protein n=1 Tax=Datura stramonium TaxID=4076 RepID=A0ABS8WZC7_DATST|nr:hypothetical protein [Datura stramonium]
MSLIGSEKGKVDTYIMKHIFYLKELRRKFFLAPSSWLNFGFGFGFEFGFAVDMYASSPHLQNSGAYNALKVTALDLHHTCMLQVLTYRSKCQCRSKENILLGLALHLRATGPHLRNAGAAQVKLKYSLSQQLS